jgi:hypothetical protein
MPIALDKVKWKAYILRRGMQEALLDRSMTMRKCHVWESRQWSHTQCWPWSTSMWWLCKELETSRSFLPAIIKQLVNGSGYIYIAELYCLTLMYWHETWITKDLNKYVYGELWSNSPTESKSVWILTWSMNHSAQERELKMRKTGPKMAFPWSVEMELFFSIFSAYVQWMLDSFISMVWPW